MGRKKKTVKKVIAHSEPAPSKVAGLKIRENRYSGRPLQAPVGAMILREKETLPPGVIAEDKVVLHYQQVLDAIRASNGFITNVADFMGTTCYTVKAYFKKYPSLQKFFDEAVERRLDEAEMKLMDKIGLGDTIATMFFLKCKGKERGFIEKDDGKKKEKKPVSWKIVPAKGVSVPERKSRAAQTGEGEAPSGAKLLKLVPKEGNTGG